MTINQYSELAIRTCKPMNEYSLHLGHMGLGLAEELLEYYEEINKIIDTQDFNELQKLIKKEMGDICWYLAGLRFIYILDKPIALFAFQDDVDPNVNDLEPVIKRIIGKIKKYYAYGKEFDVDDLRKDIEMAFIAIKLDCERYEFDFEEVLQLNIDKLKLRFPEQYTDGAAIGQADNN